MGVSGAFGGEVVFNDESGEISLFTFAGWGGTIGGGANGLFYHSEIHNLSKNDQYSGWFWIGDVSGSLGPIGVSTGTFGVPLDDPLNPSQSHGTFTGYAPGADGSASLTVVEYTQWLTYDTNSGMLTLHIMNDLSVNPGAILNNLLSGSE